MAQAVGKNPLLALLIGVVHGGSPQARHWQTQWGRSLVVSDRQYEIDCFRGLSQAQADLIATLRLRIEILTEELKRMGSSSSGPGCANDRWFEEHALMLIPRRGASKVFR